MLPVTNVNARTICSEGYADWAESFWRVAEHFLIGRHPIRASVASDFHPQQLSFAKISQKQIALILLRQRIFVVGEGARGGAASKIVHHPKRVRPPRNKVIRIPVEA